MEFPAVVCCKHYARGRHPRKFLVSLPSDASERPISQTRRFSGQSRVGVKAAF